LYRYYYTPTSICHNPAAHKERHEFFCAALDYLAGWEKKPPL
jgi:hypothetical protein